MSFVNLACRNGSTLPLFILAIQEQQIKNYNFKDQNKPVNHEITKVRQG